MSRDEPGAVPEEARALIGATWEALAEERARAARARREAEARIAELEQALAAAQERVGGRAGSEQQRAGRPAEAAARRAARQRACRAGRHCARPGASAIASPPSCAGSSVSELRLERVTRELEHERAARSAAQAERDELAAHLEHERAAHHATRVGAQEHGAPAFSRAGAHRRAWGGAQPAQARADERERRVRARAAEQVGRAVEQKRSMDRALAERSAPHQALEAVNAHVTEAARRDGLACAELTAEMERLSGERDELKALVRDEAHTRERLEQRVAELEQSARRAAEQAAAGRQT